MRLEDRDLERAARVVAEGSLSLGSGSEGRAPRLVPVVDNVGRDEREHQRDNEDGDELERGHLRCEGDERQSARA